MKRTRKGARPGPDREFVGRIMVDADGHVWVDHMPLARFQILPNSSVCYWSLDRLYSGIAANVGMAVRRVLEALHPERDGKPCRDHLPAIERGN